MKQDQHPKLLRSLLSRPFSSQAIPSPAKQTQWQQTHDVLEQIGLETRAGPLRDRAVGGRLAQDRIGDAAYLAERAVVRLDGIVLKVARAQGIRAHSYVHLGQTAAQAPEADAVAHLRRLDPGRQAAFIWHVIAEIFEAPGKILRASDVFQHRGNTPD